MKKLVLLVRRKDGMNRDEFRRYYESTHAPLAAGLMAKCTHYVRNFVDEEVSGPLDFDVVTEFWFDAEGSFQDAMAPLASAATMQTLEEDEARFMDRASMRFFTVDECPTDPAILQGNSSNAPRSGA
jgi:uncharacterized protein (TIGR02118 family)